MIRVLATVCALVLLAGCERAVEGCSELGVCVDCGATCQRMLQCNVRYRGNGPSLVPSDANDQQQCEAECMTADVITPDRATCIQEADPNDAAKCQQQILVCLGVDAGTP